MSAAPESARYLTLYRKYRSKTFTEIVGQTTPVTVLRNSVKFNRVANAYLLSGPRGTGKTSLARIFAKALNCPNVDDGEPCGVCNVCEEISSGRHLDIYELDAASHRSVEDIEQLIESAQFAPSELNYRVFIVDEVHMISDAAFNAFLKTLEEPPRHAVFVLCTTEPHKLPATILSRCIKLECTRLPLSELSAHLQHIANLEGVKLDQSAADLICDLGQCSARDALSLLEQAMSFFGNDLTADNIRDLFRLELPEPFINLAKAILSYECKTANDIFTKLINTGHATDYLLLQLSDVLKALYLDDETILKLPEDLKEFKVNPAELSSAISDLWQGLINLRDATHPVLIGQVTIFKLCERFNPNIIENKSQGIPRFNESTDNQSANDRYIPVKLEPPILVPPVINTQDKNITPIIQPPSKIEAEEKQNKTKPIIQLPNSNAIAEILGMNTPTSDFKQKEIVIAPDLVQAEIDPAIAPHWQAVLAQLHGSNLTCYCHLLKVSRIELKDKELIFIFDSKHEIDFLAFFSIIEHSESLKKSLIEHTKIDLQSLKFGFTKNGLDNFPLANIKKTKLEIASELVLNTFQGSQIK